MADAEAELDRIYALPLEEFTKARNEAAKELKARGDATAADVVAAAEKPTRAAWVVNRLAREERKRVEGLLEAGERLRDMQDRMVAGEADPGELRQAAAAEQRQIDSLMKAAKSAGGASAQVLDRVGETLQAAAGDPELARAIGAGRVDRERRASSLGILGTASPVPKAGGKGKSRGSKGEKKDAGEAERRAKRAAAADRRRAERRVAAAEKSLGRAQGLAENAERALAERRSNVEEAERELEEARAELGEASSR